MAKEAQGTEWLGDWNALGDQFWSAFRQGASQFPGMPQGNPALDQWQRMLDQSQTARGGQSEVFERGMAGMRQYVDFMQNALQQVGAQAGSAFDPSQLMHGAFRAFDVRQNPVLSAMRASAGHGALNVDQLLDGVRQFTEPFRQQMTNSLSTPAFGQHREEIERNQALASALVELQEPMGLYQSEMLQAAKRGLEIFELKLAERAEPGRELSSMRAVYDLWIDAAEEGYAEVALSPGFRRAYGAMANAQMRVRQLIQQQVERSTAAFGMPGRTEMDSVLRQLHDLRRRLGDAEERLAGSGPLRGGDAKASPTPRRAGKKAATRARAQKPAAGRRVPAPERLVKPKPRRAAAAAAVPPAEAAKKSRTSTVDRKKAGKGKGKAGKSKQSAKSAGSFAQRLAAARSTKKGK